MASIAYHHKKNGITYVYSVESYWDKEKKAPRNRQTCLGKLDPETGKLIPSARKKNTSSAEHSDKNDDGVTATTKIVGPCLLISKLAAQTGLAAILKRAFPDFHDEIMSLVHFIVHKGIPLSRADAWSQGHLHPANKAMPSQRVSDLLLKISEDERQRFLSLWLDKMIADDFLCYDITSISSYAQGNEYVRYGYNRDGEAMPQINLAMLFGQNSELPTHYRRLPGNISDVATLKTTIKGLDFLGAKSLRFVLDRGFYSQSNIDALLSARHHFTLAVPTGRKWVMEILDKHYDKIASPANYQQMNDESLYMCTERISYGEDKRRIYMHLYYNAARAAEEFDSFTKKLLTLKQTFNDGLSTKNDIEKYERYFIITDTPKRGLKIAFNDAEIQKHRKRYAGFFCILSTHLKDPCEALRIYRRKDAVENCFDDLKNQLDMKRLRVHGSAAMDSRIFLQFLALIIISALRKTARTDKTLKNMSTREIIESMETLVQIKYQDRYGQLHTEISPLQRKILDIFNITPWA
jgi:transposase